MKQTHEKLLVATGHRPNKLGGYNTRAESRRVALAIAVLKHQKPSHVITGMALGWDMAIAEAAAQLNIPYTAVIPFHGQETRWNKNDQQRYHRLLNSASDIIHVTDINTYQNPQTPRPHIGKALNDRNKYMLRLLKNNLTNGGDGILAALHDGSDGGTGNCIRYAQERDLPIINYWTSWAQNNQL